MRRPSGELRPFLALSVFWIAANLAFWLWPLPDPLMDVPLSTVLLDREGEVLSVLIADDHQYRFPPGAKLPHKYIAALLHFEDRRFYCHAGVDLQALGRATIQNITAQRVVSGGSTLTMQLARLSFRNPPRTLFQKGKEVLRALRLEMHYSKEDILRLYAAHAPFGGNNVGLETAALRYFGRPPVELSWAEAAALAVLPNSPSLIRPGKNSKVFRAKRDRLLKNLAERGELDSLTLDLAVAEPLPSEVLPLENLSPHLLTRAVNDGLKGRRLVTTVDGNLQRQVTDALNRHSRTLSGNRIFNASALILERSSGEVLAYVGNSSFEPGPGRDVDVIPAMRSPGSLLKPFLYALMLSEGSLLPRQLVPDIPASFGGFMPKNFHRTYFGAVHADEALIRSLNIPFSFLLFRYGQPRFYDRLKNMGMPLPRDAGHYGLSLILGGAENSLWGLTSMYAGLGRLAAGEKEPFFFENRYLADIPRPPGEDSDTAITPAAAWQTLEAMSLLQRPVEENEWLSFSSSRRIAWKTGTSWGSRDAWAIGVTPRYVIGVWTGNGDGEGRPGLRGLTAAAPLLFQLLNLLPDEQDWFNAPGGMEAVMICPESGLRASVDCPHARREWISRGSSPGDLCSYHKVLHLDANEKFQVTSADYSVEDMVHKSWFILPPVQAWYYSRTRPLYEPPPPLLTSRSQNSLSLLYPEEGSTLHLPVDFNGRRERALFEAVSRGGGILYWHLDGQFIGQTEGDHLFEVAPDPGDHTVLVMDGQGNYRQVHFSVISRTSLKPRL